MAPWLRVLEAWMVEQLLRTPAFHRGVEKVAKRVHQFRTGAPPEELGGTRLDDPNQPSFIKHFAEELKTQIGAAEREELDAAMREGTSKSERVGATPPPGEHNSDAAWEHIRQSAQRAHSKKAQGKRSAITTEEENADAAWQNVQKNPNDGPQRGFLGEYVDALRSQINNRSGR